MDIEWVRKYCLSFPAATEQVQWGNDLVFKVAGKMFAVAALEPQKHWLSFKCSPQEFAELTERPHVIPAPYMARALWVALETEDALPRPEVQRLLLQAYELVIGKLPRKIRSTLG
jgi:predicted DNA-binding protein (MmcQ/YjbR family)